MPCEHAVLSSIPVAILSQVPVGAGARAGAAEVPHVISYDPDWHNLVMSDCGTASSDLHAAFPSLTLTQRVDSERLLGIWLAALHSCSAIEEAALATNVAAKERRRMDQRIFPLSAGLPMASSDNGTLDQITAEQRELAELLEPFAVPITEAYIGRVVHGDFWPGYTLVLPSSTKGARDYLAVID